MTRNAFIAEMDRLRDAALTLGDLVEDNLVTAVEMLQQRDFDGSRRLIAGDAQINERRGKLEIECLTLLARQQPMAGDLRFISSVMFIANELERMNDYAKGIARINLLIGDQPLIKPLVDIPEMAQLARIMLHQSLTAFAERNEALARAVPLQDDAVDRLYNRVFEDLVAMVVADPAVADQMNYLLWAAHNLERAADRVTNICERVVYIVTGKMVELNQETGVADIA